jgi:hypothetical protein
MNLWIKLNDMVHRIHPEEVDVKEIPDRRTMEDRQKISTLQIIVEADRNFSAKLPRLHHRFRQFIPPNSG